MPQELKLVKQETKTEKPRPAWEKPRILSRQVLEVFAATCTQPGSKPDPILCPSGPPQS